MAYNTDSCGCRRVDSREDVEASHGTPGDYWLDTDKALIWLVLPSGARVVLPVAGSLVDECQHPQPWHISGTIDCLTLMPSIDNRPTPPPHSHIGWHGFLADGRLVSC